jgi:acyl-coenzyme A thioesterase PaaI-like protein
VSETTDFPGPGPGPGAENENENVNEPRGPRDVPRSTGDVPVNRLATAVRRISAVAVGLPDDDDGIDETVDRLEQIADELDRRAARARRPRSLPDLSGHPQDFFPASPMLGYANPIAPPAEVWAAVGEDGRPEIRGRVTFGHPYEGPPNCVHGGVIAELFDELMGAANVVADRPAMTGTLTVRYRKPTPLLAPLDLVARTTGGEGRKVLTWAGIYHDGELTAEADGLFIEARARDMQALMMTNASATNTDEPVIDPAMARQIAENAAG